MAEISSKIRIKRGTEDKISKCTDTLPKGSLLYNETKNTLIVSDGKTKLYEHPVITTDSIHTKMWTVTEKYAAPVGLNALEFKNGKDDVSPIYIVGYGNYQYPRSSTIISKDSIRAKYLQIIGPDGNCALNISDNDILYAGDKKVNIEKLIIDVNNLALVEGYELVSYGNKQYIKIPSLLENALSIPMGKLKAGSLLRFVFNWHSSYYRKCVYDIRLDQSTIMPSIDNTKTTFGSSNYIEIISGQLQIWLDNEGKKLKMGWGRLFRSQMKSDNNINFTIEPENSELYPYLESISLVWEGTNE